MANNVAKYPLEALRPFPLTGFKMLFYSVGAGPLTLFDGVAAIAIIAPGQLYRAPEGMSDPRIVSTTTQEVTLTFDADLGAVPTAQATTVVDDASIAQLRQIIINGAARDEIAGAFADALNANTDRTLTAATIQAIGDEFIAALLDREDELAAANGKEVGVWNGMASLPVHPVTDVESNIAANPARRSLVLQVQDGSDDIFVGGPGVTTASGFQVKAGADLEIPTRSAVHFICAAGEAGTVRVIEAT